jgi:hypothetical protein
MGFHRGLKVAEGSSSEGSSSAGLGRDEMRRDETKYVIHKQKSDGTRPFLSANAGLVLLRFRCVLDDRVCSLTNIVWPHVIWNCVVVHMGIDA